MHGGGLSAAVFKDAGAASFDRHHPGCCDGLLASLVPESELRGGLAGAATAKALGIGRFIRVASAFAGLPDAERVRDVSAAPRSGPALPASFEDAASSASVADAELPGVMHGRTARDEVCKCLPGTLLPPKPQAELDGAEKASLEASRAAVQQVHKRMHAAAEKLVTPKLERFEELTKEHDVVMQALAEKSTAAERAAEAVRDAYGQVNTAYSEANCKEVAKHAAEDGEDPPRCEESYKQATQQLKALSASAQPTCDAGAVTFQALREHAAPQPLVIAEIAVAAGAWRGACASEMRARCRRLMVPLQIHAVRRVARDATGRAFL